MAGIMTNEMLTQISEANFLPAQIQERITAAVQGSIRDYYAGLSEDEFIALRNILFDSLVPVIGRTLYTVAEAYDPFGKFLKGSVAYGQGIRQIYVSGGKMSDYDPTGENVTAPIAQPGIDVRYYTRNKEYQYSWTVYDNQLAPAFAGDDEMETFLGAQARARANNYMEDNKAQTLIALSAALNGDASQKYKGIAKLYIGALDFTQLADTQKLVFAIKRMHRIMMDRNTELNASGLPQSVMPGNQHTFINTIALTGAEVYANPGVFNTAGLAFPGEITEVNTFATNTSSTDVALNRDKVVAVIGDKDWYQIYTNYDSSGTFYNAKGKFTNTFETHQSMRWFNPYASQVAIIAADAPAGATIIDGLGGLYVPNKI